MTRNAEMLRTVMIVEVAVPERPNTFLMAFKFVDIPAERRLVDAIMIIQANGISHPR